MLQLIFVWLLSKEPEEKIIKIICHKLITQKTFRSNNLLNELNASCQKQPQISKRHERKNFLIVNCVSNKFAESIKLYITLANDNTTRENDHEINREEEQTFPVLTVPNCSPCSTNTWSNVIIL
jgi:hypothetical protein